MEQKDIRKLSIGEMLKIWFVTPYYGFKRITKYSGVLPGITAAVVLFIVIPHHLLRYKFKERL